MGDRKTANVEKRARLWGDILGTLRRRGRIEVEHLACRTEPNAREVDAACREMSALGWLQPGTAGDGWVADGSAAELLTRYPPLRSDAASPCADRTGFGEPLAG